MRQKLKRTVSGMLSVAMITSTLFTDFTFPAFADTSTKPILGVSHNLTSDYIAASLSKENAEIVSERNEQGFTEMLYSQMEAISAVSFYSDEENINSSGNDPEEVKELVDEMMEAADSITPAADYDENGLAPTYHYITLNYTLVENDAVWDGMRITDIWEKVPEAFIASYLTTLNVYTQQGNEDYFIAMANPASLNGLGNAIYADFTDGNTEAPTVYNDRISFDTKTGLIYIPKSFYFDESGKEILKQLEAQVLVPYSFDDDKASISVTTKSEIEGVTTLSGRTDTAALDVTITVPIVEQKDANQISIEDLCVTVNNDVLPFDLTDGGGYYDQETGELTLAAAGNTVYAVDVKIKEDAAQEAQTQATERDVLLAGVGDISGFIARDIPFYGDVSYATDVASMKTLPGVTLTAENVVRGQIYSYSGAYEYVNNYNSANTDKPSKIITNTALFAYYYLSGGSSTAVDDSNMGGVNADGSVTHINSNSGSTVLCNTAKPDSTFNRIVSLPDGVTLTSTNGAGTIIWDCNITGNPAGYGNFAALHCVASATASTGIASGTGNLTIRILYHKAATASAKGYTVFSVTSPTSYTQAGCAVYKVEEEKPPKEKYRAWFGINKVSSANTSEKLSSYFGYKVSSSAPTENSMKMYAAFAADLAEQYDTGDVTSTGLKNLCTMMPFSGKMYTSSTSGIAAVSLNSDNSNVLENCDGNSIYVTIIEVGAPEGYTRKTGVWVLKITPSSESYSKSTLNSVTYYSYNSAAGTLGEGTNVTKNGYYFTAENTPKNYYAKLGFDKYEYNPDNTAGSRLSGAVIGIAESEAQAQAGALTGGTSNAKSTIKTSSSVNNHLISLGQGVTITTVYAYEASAPEGYKRNTGYWKIVLQGTTDTSGSGTKIVSAMYYDYSSSSGKWGSYTLSTATHYNYNRGWYTQGSDSVIPVVHVTDKKLYYYSFGVNKYNPLKERLGATYTVATSITSNGSSFALSGTTVGTVSPTSSAAAYLSAYSSTSTSMTFYMMETAAPSGYIKNTGYWKISMSGTTASNGIGSTITSVTYYPSTSGGTSLGTTATYAYDSTYGYKGFYSAGSSSNRGTVSVINTQYYSRIGLYKTDSVSGSFVDGATYVLTTSEATAQAGANGTSTSNGVSAVTTGTSVVYFDTQAMGASSSKTYYIYEKTAPSEYERNTGYWAVTVTGTETNTTGDGTQITKLTYYSNSNGTFTANTLSASSSKTGIKGYLIDGTTDAVAAPDQPIRLYGQFGIKKMDDEGTVMSGIRFDVYSDQDCKNKVTTITTDENGMAVYTLPTWYATSGTTKTFYVKENAASVDTFMYTADSSVYQVKITGSKEKAASCTVKVNNLTTGKQADVDTATLSFTVINDRIGHPELPVTGGIGTYIFYFIAVIAALAAIMAFYKGRKYGKEADIKKKE